MAASGSVGRAAADYVTSMGDWRFEPMAGRQGATDSLGVQGAHLNPLGLFLNPLALGLFLRTSIPFAWRILTASPTRLTPLADRTCFSQAPASDPSVTALRAELSRSNGLPGLELLTPSDPECVARAVALLRRDGLCSRGP